MYYGDNLPYEYIMYKNQYNRKQKKAISGAKILTSIIGLAAVICLLWFLSTLGTKKDVVIDPTLQTPINTGGNSPTSDWYVGKKISAAGTITPASGTLDYTHTLTLSGSSDTIPVMSSTLDLSPYK